MHVYYVDKLQPERGGTKKKASKGKDKATTKKVVMHLQLQNLPCDSQCKCQDSKKEKGTFDIHVGSAPKRDGPPEVIISNHHYFKYSNYCVCCID